MTACVEKNDWRGLSLALALSTLLTGCALAPWRAAKAPAATVTAPGLSLTQSGDTPSPAAVNVSTSRASLPLPAGSVVQVGQSPSPGLPVENKGLSVALPTPSVLSVETVSTVASGPRSFAPPAPPSPAELAAGRATLWLRLGLVAGIAAAAFGLVRGWDLLAIGGGCIAAACMVAEMINRIPPWLWVVLGLGGAAALIGPGLWHLKIKGLVKNEK